MTRTQCHFMCHFFFILKNPLSFFLKNLKKYDFFANFGKISRNFTKNQKILVKLAVTLHDF